MKESVVEMDDVIDILNKCWLTHDGMWFFHSLMENGIETTNKINKAAIKSLASIETGRIKKAVKSETPAKDFESFKTFFKEAASIMIPEFMGVKFSFPKENIMEWKFRDGECFAYKGIKRMGVIEEYECGALYRIKCWLSELGIEHRFLPGIDKCHMHFKGKCSGIVELSF